MNRTDIEALMRGIAPSLLDLVQIATAPLLDRIAELEAREFPSAVDPAPIIRGVVSQAVPLAVAEAVAALPPREPGLPGKDADPVDIERMILAAVQSLPAPKNGLDGRDVDPDTVRQMIADEVAMIPAPADGMSVDPSDVDRMVAEAVVRTLAEWERPQDGISVTIEDVAPVIDRAIAEAIAALPAPEPGAPGTPGKLGMVRAWEDTVFYESDVVTFSGAIYQAQRDTGRAPPHDDWLCIVARGEPAESPAEIEITGTFDVTRAYRKLNVVALNGGSFIAKQDGPGPCPGDGWQLVASQGNRGKPGDSVKGDPGRPGPAVRAIEVDDQGMLTLINADGTKVECDLYPLLAQIASTSP